MRKAIDNLLLYAGEYRGYAERFASETNGNSETYAISSMKDIGVAIENFSNVKFLEIMLHGNPGTIRFADGGGMAGSYLGKIAQGKPFIQKDARILFDSCSIGAGASGDKFMDDLGQTLLTGKGGTIGAATVNIIGYFRKENLFLTGAYMEEFSSGRLKVVRYDTSGKRIAQQTVDRYGIVR